MRRLARKVKRRLVMHQRYRRFNALAGGAGADREIAVVLGNCQSDPLAQLLRSGSVGERYEVVRIPPVHLIDREQTSALHRLMPRVGLFIAQRVRDGYRGLEIGTDELESRLPSQALRVHYPVMYYEGLYPYQVYVRHRGDTSEMAPRTAYSDLRTISAAAQGLFGEEGLAAARSLAASADAIRANAERSLGLLRDREADLEVTASEAVRDGLVFHTVNHPSNELIAHVGDGVASHLEMPHRHGVPAQQFLDDIYSPFRSEVAQALSVDQEPRDAWRIHSKTVDDDEVIRAHLEWFRSRPELIEAAVRQHGRKLEALGFPA